MKKSGQVAVKEVWKKRVNEQNGKLEKKKEKNKEKYFVSFVTLWS